MASPQLEEGCVKVALDLWQAIDQADLTSLERRGLDAIMFLTYGAGKKKAEMTVEDIRYVLGASDKLRTDRLEAALDRLLKRNMIFRYPLGEVQIWGVQKDYEQWLTSSDKMSDLSNYVTNSNKTITTIRSRSDKMSAPERLMAYAMKSSKFQHGIASYKTELKQAKRLYLQVIAKTQSGPKAFNLICDYIDENEWMRKNVRMQFTFMASRFEAWRSQIPRKPRDVKDDEEALGKHYRYDVTNKHWLPCEHRGKEG